MMEAITVNKLSKKYNNKTAVNEVSFSVGTGEIFGLIGPDGAGKTSIFRMLTTLLLPDGGTATVDGLDIVRDYSSIRARVGYMPGKFSLYPDLSIEENLNFFATIFNTTVAENYELIKQIYLQIEPFKHRRAGKLSGGMKQKLALCCALIHCPSVLFLDEPTTGVDPVSRKDFWAMLKQLKAQNITILVSTPYMDEANLCDRIALMQDGRVLSVDTPANITRSYPVPLYAAKADQMHSLLKALKQSAAVSGSYAFGEYAHFTLSGPEADLETVRFDLQDLGLTAIELIPAEVTIEDSFISLLHA
jgi:ABC-2 type transport system ATP-binding protein